MATGVAHAWRTHGRIVLSLLDALTPGQLAAAPSARERSVGAHLAHLHQNRLSWLQAMDPVGAERLPKLNKVHAADAASLRAALEASAEAVRAVLAAAEEQGGRVKGYKPGAAAFFGYLVAHESYHVGKIDFILRQAGLPVDDRTHYALFDWAATS